MLQNLSGTNTWTGTVALGYRNQQHDHDHCGTLTITGVISGAGNVTTNGAGTLSLPNANTYTGTTTVSAGTVNIANATSLGTAAGNTTIGAATLQVQGGITVAEPLTTNANAGKLENVSGNNTWTGNFNLANDNFVFFTDGSTTLTYSGVISGGGKTPDVDSSGAGTVIFTATNTSTQTLDINGGTAQVDGTWAGTAHINGGALRAPER